MLSEDVLIIKNTKSIKLLSHVEEIPNVGTTAIGMEQDKGFFFQWNRHHILRLYGPWKVPMDVIVFTRLTNGKSKRTPLTIKKCQIINTFNVLIPRLRAIFFSYLCFISRENRQMTPI